MASDLDWLQVTSLRKTQSDLDTDAHGATVPSIYIHHFSVVDDIFGQLDLVGRARMARGLKVGQVVKGKNETRARVVWNEYATHVQGHGTLEDDGSDFDSAKWRQGQVNHRRGCPWLS